MTDFLFFVLNPALLTATAILARKRTLYQISATVLLGLLIILVINFEGWGVAATGWKTTIGGGLLDLGPLAAVALFLLAIHRNAGKRPGVLMIGVPAIYFLGFAAAVQIGMLLGWVQP